MKTPSLLKSLRLIGMIGMIGILVLSGCFSGRDAINERRMDVSLIVDGKFAVNQNKDEFKKYLNDFVMPFQINNKDCLVTIFPSVNVMTGSHLSLKHKIPKKLPNEYILMARKNTSALRRFAGLVNIADISKTVHKEFLKEDISPLWKGNGADYQLSISQLLKAIPAKNTEETNHSREFVIVTHGEKSHFDVMVKKFGFSQKDIEKSDSIFHFASASNVLTEYKKSITNLVCKNRPKNLPSNLDLIVIDVTGFNDLQPATKSDRVHSPVKNVNTTKLPLSSFTSSSTKKTAPALIQKEKLITKSKSIKSAPVVPVVPVVPIIDAASASVAPSPEIHSVTSCAKLLDDLHASLKRQDWTGERKPWNIANHITMQPCSPDERERYRSLCPSVQALESRFSCPD